ncbi:MAG: M67 family metallopeptidase [Zetaproteobacteria bacterium]|nr:M67 family metallopeptidase [Zetaproteobacteria bacterium]
MHEPERFRSEAYLAVIDSSPSSNTVQYHHESIQSMENIAKSTYPAECCGLIIGTLTDGIWHVHDVREAKNLNAERANDRFQLDPDAYQTLDRELKGSPNEIIGVFHSHPDCPAKPSPTDIAHAWEGFIYPIVAVDQGEIHSIQSWALNAKGDQFQEVTIHA